MRIKMIFASLLLSLLIVGCNGVKAETAKVSNVTTLWNETINGTECSCVRLSNGSVVLLCRRGENIAATTVYMDGLMN